MEADSAGIIRPLASILDRLDLAALFRSPGPVEVELGSGDGSFLVDYAVRNPATNFIGVERLAGRLRKLGRKGKRAGLTNLVGLRIESSYFLEFLLPPASISAIHVYFPDPWPKRKHRHFRLINERFTHLAAGVLGDGGDVHLRTDDTDYHTQMCQVFGSDPRFVPAKPGVGLIALSTDFERGFNARGIPTLSASYRLLKRQ